jgi:hypothetical protein
LEGLCPEERAVPELTYDLGHSCGEIAAIMDCPFHTVKRRVYHARDKLRRLVPILASTGGEPKACPRITSSRFHRRRMSLGNAVCVRLLALKA